MYPILCISDFELQCKYLEKFKSNRATKNRRRKSKGFLHERNCCSPVPHTNFLRPESYNSAATYYMWRFHLGDLFKSERWSQPNLNDLLQQLQHLSVWCNHVLNRLKECSSFFISRKQRTVPAMVHVSISF